MSTGQWIGAILGFIVGFVVSGFNPYWGIYGAIIGYTIGGYIDPVKPDVKQPGAPAPLGLQVMTNIIGNPIFDVLGTAKITGQLLFFGKEFNRAIWYRPSKGVRAISGYKYYASWTLGICIGSVDILYTVFRDQDPIWSGELTRPVSGGEATIQIEEVGSMTFYFGTDDQMPNTNAGLLLPDPTLNTGHRNLCWAFFDACFINEYNRMPSMSFMVRKTPPMFSEETKQIQTFDTNPAHAIWYTLINKAGLPEAWVHSADFLAVAVKLYTEGRGISILFDTHQATQNYLEAINSHVDNILLYGSDGKFHPKLIRYDYTPVDLPLIDESKLIEEPTFSRRSWIDTINEVKAQYSEILGERIILQNANLIGWYKFDEGSGLVAYNSATDGSLGGGLLPNLTVNGETTFWATPGFARSPETLPGSQVTNAWAEASLPGRNIGGASQQIFMGVFYRNTSIAGAGQSGLCCLNTIRTAHQFGISRITSGHANQYFLFGTSTFVVLPNNQTNLWTFMFFSDEGGGAGRFRTVLNDGTLVSAPSDYTPGTVTVNFIEAGCYFVSPPTGLYPAKGDYGDLIIYQVSGSTLTQWAEWYDKLRSRYGMAARDGW